MVDSTLDRDTRLSANTATAVAVLAPVTAEPGTVVTVSGPQRLRVAVELGLPLDRVRDLFLAGRSAPSTAPWPAAPPCSTTSTATALSSGSPLSTTVPSRVGGSSWSHSAPIPNGACTSTGSRGRAGEP